MLHPWRTVRDAIAGLNEILFPFDATTRRSERVLMQPSAIGMPVLDLDTPALLLDLDAFEHNVALMAEHFREREVAWRPHAKAFKCPAIAHVLRKAGAIGVTVAKVSEAEVMAAGGIDDILIAHLVVGPAKTARLAALQRRADVKVTVDHPDHVCPLGQAARRKVLKSRRCLCMLRKW